MSRNEPKFPWRVVVIAVVLFGGVVAAGWLILRPGDNPGDPSAGPAATPPTVDPGAQQIPPPAANPDTPGVTVDPATLEPDSSEALAALPAARAAAGTMDLQLFLIVPGIERLIPVPRTVAAPPPTIDAQVRIAVEELIHWTGTETISPVAPESSVREVWVSEDRIAYIDFDRAFYDFSGGGSLAELHTIYSIVATVTESFPEIVAVQFLIEGEQEETLAGHIDLSRPLLPSEEWVLIEQREPAEAQQPQTASGGEPRLGG